MSSRDKAIHFIMTGGTIDSHFDGSKDTAVPNKESVIPSFMRSLKLYKEAIFTTAFLKDSRDIGKKDLVKLLKIIKNY
ncbi:MAG: hypothetical protein WCT40_05115 [Candidatus Magasanikbacteria bacterium]|jgi:L-asparaginase/Glu-tRNA(Gln) amidotransferase subunit D